jgi:hypothetical protein
MVIIRLRDILLLAADNDFLRESARLDNNDEWMKEKKVCAKMKIRVNIRGITIETSGTKFIP